DVCSSDLRGAPAALYDARVDRVTMVVLAALSVVALACSGEMRANEGEANAPESATARPPAPSPPPPPSPDPSAARPSEPALQLVSALGSELRIWSEETGLVSTGAGQGRI